MVKRLPLVAAIGAILLLTACGGNPPSTAPTTSASASGTTTQAPPATTTPTDSGTDTSALTAGNCTAADAQVPIPVVYTVYTSDSTTPVTIQYMAFNTDGTTPIQTLTAVGPVINILGYSCTSASDSATWVLRASATTSDKIACVLDYGAMLVNTKSAFAEHNPAILIHVDCSGNPGE